jgi:DNA-binding CsgD family transcriptional regulator
VAQQARLTTRAERESFRSIRRACYAGLDSITLREEVARRAAGVVPTDACALTATDPDTGLFTHGWVDGLPQSFVRSYLTHLYPEEAVQFIDLARSGRTSSTARSGAYGAVLRAEGLEHRVHTVLCADGELWGTWCMFRRPTSPAFSERELRFLGVVAPHIGYGLRAAAMTEAARAGGTDAPATTPAVLVLDARRRITMRGGPAATHLDDLANVGIDSELLPFAVMSLLASLDASARARIEPLSAELRAQGRSGCWYVLRATVAEPDAGGESATIITIEPTGARPGATALTHVYSLTQREREVVQLVLRGESTKRIGVRLGVSIHTVQDHLGRACEKVGVRGRKALVSKLYFDNLARDAD